MVQSVLPIFRSFMAKELVKRHGLSQTDVAKRLGITQAAVSQYLCSKRGKGGTRQSNMNEIRRLAKRTASEISKNKTFLRDPMGTACKLCTNLHLAKRMNQRSRGRN